MKTVLPLSGNTQATARMVAIAALVGGALTAAWAMAMAQTFGLALGSPVKFGVAGAVVTPLIAFALTKLRQPRGASIVIDDWGVTELDGEGVRTAIAGEKLRAQLGFTRKQNLPGGNALANAVAGAVLNQADLPNAIGGHLVLSDEDGRRIDVTQGVQNATLNRRLSTVDSIGLITTSDVVKAARQGHADALPSSENVMVLGYMLGLLGYLAALGALVGMGAPNVPEAPVIAAIAIVALLLRSLPWWKRARALSKLDAGAKKVTLAGGDARQLRVRGADGETAIDLVALKHPDAALHTRAGEAWLTAGTIETADMRAARHSRATATRLEAALRTLLAVLVFLPAAPALWVMGKELKGGVAGVQLVSTNHGGTGLAIDAKSGLALVIDYSGLRLIDVRTGVERPKLGIEDCREGQAWLVPGRLVLSCDAHGGPFRLYALNESGLSESVNIAADLLEPQMVFDGDRLVTGDSSARVSTWQLEPLQKLKSMPYFSFSLRGLAVSPTTHEIVFSGWESGPSKAQRWNGENDGKATAIEASHDTTGAVAFSPDGKRLALAMKGGVQLIDGDTFASLGEVQLDVRGVTSLAFSPDNRTLAIATNGRGYTDKNFVFFAEVPTMKVIGQRPTRWRRSTFDFDNLEPARIAYEDDGKLLVLTRTGTVLRMTPE